MNRDGTLAVVEYAFLASAPKTGMYPRRSDSFSYSRMNILSHRCARCPLPPSDMDINHDY